MRFPRSRHSAVRPVILTCLLVGLGWPVHGAAQEKPADSTAEATSRSGAQPAGADSAPKEGQTQEVVITDEARRHFRAGVNLLQDPDGARYAEAYLEFKRAYEESASWKILGNLGITAMKLERDGEAISAFEKYLEEGGDDLDEAERAQVQRDLETLRARVTWVTVDSVPPGATLVDRRIPPAGRPTENRYEALDEPRRIGLRTGTHELTARLDGHEPATWEFEAVGGELEHTFELKKIERPPARPAPPQQTQDIAPVVERPTPAAVYVGLATTGALAVGATVTGIVALDKKSQFDAANGSDPELAQSLKSDGQTLNVMTDVFMGTAIVAAGTTAVLYFMRPEVAVQPRDVAAVEPGVTFEPSVMPGGGGLWMRGVF